MRRRQWWEESIFLVGTPQCLLAEGLADLGLEVADRNIVDQFFDERCSRQVKTAITTNLVCPTPKRPDCAFKEAYGDRVVSRMAQNGTFAHTGTLDLRRSR